MRLESYLQLQYFLFCDSMKRKETMKNTIAKTMKTPKSRERRKEENQPDHVLKTPYPKTLQDQSLIYSIPSLKGAINGLLILLGLAARLLLPDLNVAVANCSLLSVLASNPPLPPGNCSPGVVAKE